MLYYGAKQSALTQIFKFKRVLWAIFENNKCAKIIALIWLFQSYKYPSLSCNKSISERELLQLRAYQKKNKGILSEKLDVLQQLRDQVKHACKQNWFLRRIVYILMLAVFERSIIATHMVTNLQSFLKVRFAVFGQGDKKLLIFNKFVTENLVWHYRAQ